MTRNSDLDHTAQRLRAVPPWRVWFPTAVQHNRPSSVHQAPAMPRSSHCDMAMKHDTYRQVCAFVIRPPNVHGP